MARLAQGDLMMRRRASLVATAAFLVCNAGAQAQRAYPNKPIKIVVR
jgi:hypothetical protein